MKLCGKCQYLKPVEAFALRNNAPDGRAFYCRDCQAAYTKEWRTKNAAKIKEEKARYYVENKERHAARAAEYRKRNADELKEAKAAYFQDNKEKIYAYNRKYLAANKDAIKAYQAKWRAANPDVYKAVVANNNANRRTAELAGVDARGLAEWVSVAAKVCFYCEAVCDEEFHIDHFDPLSKGGKHELDNLKIACPTCNLKKNAKSPLVFMGLA